MKACPNCNRPALDTDIECVFCKESLIATSGDSKSASQFESNSHSSHIALFFLGGTILVGALSLFHAVAEVIPVAAFACFIIELAKSELTVSKLFVFAFKWVVLLIFGYALFSVTALLFHFPIGGR